MSLLALLRKGLGYMLMCMGASSPDTTKKKPSPKPAAKPGSGL
jgi:hypothetical protein